MERRWARLRSFALDRLPFYGFDAPFPVFVGLRGKTPSASRPCLPLPASDCCWGLGGLLGSGKSPDVKTMIQIYQAE